ncbi:MAG: AAA family ATPase [Candidatus Aenigmatarchaeota archaeon]
MIIKSLQVQNFRCIKNETLPCENLTALVGPNGSGKSSFLQALEMFYTPSASYTEDDFYNGETSKPITITVTFANLTEKEKQLFQKYIKNDELTVEKILKWPPGRANQSYHGNLPKNPDFEKFRSAHGVELRKEYKKLREDKYSDLPSYSNKDEAEANLQKWESHHPDQCVPKRDEGQFFGFKEVGGANLKYFTSFILIPAVRDASEDAEEGRNSLLTNIMDLVVRSVLAKREEIQKLKVKTQEQYEEIVRPAKLDELQTLERELSSTLKTYVPDASVDLTWLTEDAIEIPMPKADIKLVEDEYPSSVERTGHGLQRAFILTMLQHLAVAQAAISEDTDDELDQIPKEHTSPKVPNLIIGIEEPELYQHPNRQRHLSKILLKLVRGGIEGVADCAQIIYSTHSPLFVDIKRFDKVRVLRKVKEETNNPKQTKVIHTNLDEIAKIIEKADGKSEGTYSGETLEPRLQTLMTPWMNEGFFADVAVLVEGEEDRAAVLGIAKALGHDLESMGISVIPCMSKNNLDRPTAIFKKLQIPVYVIWDGDCGDNNCQPEENHRLLRLVDHPVVDWPEIITEEFACFKKTLSDTLRAEIGEQLYTDNLDACCERFSLTRKNDAVKNPQVIEEIIKNAKKQGKTSETLEKIISKIIDLKKRKIKVRENKMS